VSEHIELEEEEFDSRFSGQTIRRLVTLLRPYTLWVLGFLTAVLFVSGLDSYFTYLSKQDGGRRHPAPGNRWRCGRS
jgi:hypothetical protein